MAEGNGIDLGSIYGLLVEIGKTVSQMNARVEHLDARVERLEAKFERHGAMLEQLATLATQQDRRLRHLEETMVTRADLADLRQTVEAYHSSVVGQGITTSELEGRVQRIEGHLDLPPFVHG